MSPMHRISTKTTARARKLRHEMTDAERCLWRAIRNKQLNDNRFRRQLPIGQYIVDFACIERRLVIEIDGGQHGEQEVADQQRTAFLQAQGWRVLRFWNHEVLTNLEGVFAVIVDTLGAAPPSQPSPFQGEGAFGE